ncbi:MAG: hypothetical protein FWC76_05385 [Defluviitaleaceae bacterium]|nr:hypothetical protein [Defluviitaleaceae bacterium]
MIKDLIERHGKKRVFVISYAALFVLLAIIYFAMYRAEHTYAFGEATLRVTSVDFFTGDVEARDGDGNVIIITRRWPWLHLPDMPLFLQSSNDFTIQYLDKTITYSIINDEEGHRRVYTFSDGTQAVAFTPPIIDRSPALDTRYMLIFETTLQHEEAALMHWLIGFAHNHTPVQTYVMLATFSAALLPLGLGFLLYPEVFWQLRMTLLVRGGKPNENVLVLYTISGVIIMALAFAPAIILLL